MTDVTLTPKQMKAFALATSPIEKAHYIVGYAGTGKTTVLSQAAKELGSKCCVLTPTNKAAQVLRDKGICQAKTIHSALYMPNVIDIYQKDKDGNVEFIKDSAGNYVLDEEGARIPIIIGQRLSFDFSANREELPPIALVDEASMIKPEEVADLLDAFRNVIFFGDGFQLPPVKATDIFAKATPDVFLDEVHRVALDNPIIRYATALREGRELTQQEAECFEIRFCNYNNSKLWEAINEHNVQSICWTNSLRHEINNQVRKQKGYAENKLCQGEKIIALQNVREGQGEDRYLKFYNGEIVYVNGEYERTEDHFVSAHVKTACGRKNFMWPFWNKGFFEIRDDNQAWQREIQLRKATGSGPLAWGADFDFAYALTAHKAQGSEFENVAVFDQRSQMTRSMAGDMRQRWFYTSVTRAKKRVLIVR